MKFTVLICILYESFQRFKFQCKRHFVFNFNISGFNRRNKMKRAPVFKLDLQQYNCEQRIKFHSLVLRYSQLNIHTNRQTTNNRFFLAAFGPMKAVHIYFFLKCLICAEINQLQIYFRCS